jgi:CHRD domain
MSRRFPVIISAGAVLVALAAGSYALAAQGVARDNGPKFTASLKSYSEVPAVSSTGTGTFEAKLEDAATLHYKLTYSGLEGGNTLFAHVHIGQQDVNGGVSFFLCGGGGKPACPNGEGTVEGDVTPADVLALATQQVPAGAFDEVLQVMRDGQSYANVHSASSPGGEIRGQVKGTGPGNGNGN